MIRQTTIKVFKMFSIRRIYDYVLPVNRLAVDRVQEILKEQFPLLSQRDIAKIPEQLRNPFKYRFRSILFVAEDLKGEMHGFAMLMLDPALGLCYLDFISAAKGMTGRGIGGALYERVREEAAELGVSGIFFECLPDDPALCRDPAALRQNRKRLAFYERYGARPVAGTSYETPVKPDDDCPPYLVFDGLGKNTVVPLESSKAIVRAILERKYAHVCPKSYIDMVVGSFKDEPMRLRPARYVKTEPAAVAGKRLPEDRLIALAINDRHDIHHVRERGYVESPVRIKSILRELDCTSIFEKVKIRHYSEKHIRAVHDRGFVDYLKAVCAKLPADKAVYPYVFPIRNATRQPKEMAVRAGYFCIDTFTPLTRNAYLAAKRAVDCALTGANLILEGRRLAYALVRPPGHHAEKRVFGGFCYFNSAAAAANFLANYGKVAVMDIDYHHGNGTQEIFYERSDVLTVSIHGHPSFAFPYFSGFRDERGFGPGLGYNINMPLQEHLDGAGYREALSRAVERVRRFRPEFLIIALGLDTAKGDPTGTWNLVGADFEENGAMLGRLLLPTLVVQEGGYDSRVLGSNARRFFKGLWEGSYVL
jgi:acetoin utilization deacetylase AcuC-like enzyme/GNAT superfamily N-acetyltransferase